MSRLPFVFAVIAAIAFVVLGGGKYVTLSALAANAVWLRELTNQWHILAPLLFIVANAVLLMVLVVPSWFCSIAGGLLFGRWLGMVYALVGTVLGATAVFIAARSGLRGLTERAGPLAGRTAEGFRTNALSYVVFLRLVPVFPFTLVNIAAAVAGVPMDTYVLGTFLGIIPSVFIYASLGDVLLALAQEGRLPGADLLLQPRFLAPVLGLAALALLPVVVRLWRRGASRR